MEGLTNLMASMSVGVSQATRMSQVSIAMLKNAMNVDVSASNKLMESISESAPSADGRGALMDVRA